MEENFERAAAIAVFHGHVRRAVESLKDGAGLANQKGDTTKSEFLIINSINIYCLIRQYVEHNLTWFGWLFSK